MDKGIYWQLKHSYRIHKSLYPGPEWRISCVSRSRVAFYVLVAIAIGTLRFDDYGPTATVG